MKIQHTPHNMYGTRPHRIWSAVKRRCLYEKYPEYYLYGGRGITVDDKWLTFNGFWEDMKEGYADNLTIDRINNEGGYCKTNCRWVTQKEQNRNRRNTIMATYQGKTMSVDDWCEDLKLNKRRIKKRLKMGWSIEDAFTKGDSHVRYITVDGLTLSLIDWSKRTGISYSALTHMIYRKQDYISRLRNRLR